MILQALYRLAEREGLLEDLDFEVKPVAYLVRVGEGGRFLGIQTTKEFPAAEGKRRPLPQAKRFRVPREDARTSGDRAFFLYDKAEYALGLDPEADPAKRRLAEKLAQRFALFRDRARACAEATGDPGAQAVSAFLEAVAGGLEVQLPEDCASNDLFAFTYAPDDGTLVTERPAVRAYWQKLRGEGGGDGGFLCLVSGKNAGVPGNHPQLHVPGAVTSGVPLVSFNQRAFESQGWKGAENAAVSREAAEGYATALKRLLDRLPLSAGGVALPRRNLSLAPDTTLCYWAEATDDAFAGFLADLLEANPEQVRETFHSLWKGHPPTLSAAEAGAFYGLVLTGAQGRVVVRTWFETTVEEAVRHLALYFQDLDLAANAPPGKDGFRPPAVPLHRLLQSLAPLGKGEDIPAHLASQLVEAALWGGRFPLSLLQPALLRTRAEVGASSWADLQRRDARTALIKGVLIRNFGKEISPLLDPTNTEPGYLLG
ncbi:MAG: type I-C CRISPR-associated protein Cas8c/Csd1, partial [Acidobacteria bacterium]|nr:type I-C CRISPR-associated protein Cas8c/Csd1 [Acidobacteriota bacterium]